MAESSVGAQQTPVSIKGWMVMMGELELLNVWRDNQIVQPSHMKNVPEIYCWRMQINEIHMQYKIST